MMKSEAPHHPELVGVMNDTKWEELRCAMLEMDRLHPQFQIKDVASATPDAWDGEWYYHFRLRPYSTIEWCDIRVSSEDQRQAVRDKLRAIHLPGQTTDDGFRIYGWVQSGVHVKYLE